MVQTKPHIMQRNNHTASVCDGNGSVLTARPPQFGQLAVPVGDSSREAIAATWCSHHANRPDELWSLSLDTNRIALAVQACFLFVSSANGAQRLKELTSLRSSENLCVRTGHLQDALFSAGKKMPSARSGWGWSHCSQQFGH